jgi:hypothetical protein
VIAHRSTGTSSKTFARGVAGLGERGDLLPDDEIVRAGKEIRWAPGALDGVFGHHVGSSETVRLARTWSGVSAPQRTRFCFAGRRFPGKGWRLIQAGLQSPTVRNRNMAVQALATWDRALWAAEAQALLRRAIAAEPMDRTRAIMEKVLAGEVLKGN